MTGATGDAGTAGAEPSIVSNSANGSSEPFAAGGAAAAGLLPVPNMSSRSNVEAAGAAAGGAAGLAAAGAEPAAGPMIMILEDHRNGTFFVHPHAHAAEHVAVAACARAWMCVWLLETGHALSVACV
jgi:hypothetical protein